MSTVSIRETLLQEVSILPTTYCPEVLDFIETLKTNRQSVPPQPEQPSKLPFGRGCMKGKMWIADDFDAPLEDFKEYME
jgi:hypothetical protein